MLRAIGISNFSSKKMGDLLSFCRVKPVMNQVELHPYLQQWELKEYCEKNGCYLTAFFPLGGAADISNPDGVMNNAVIKEIAKNHNKTAAQVLIRWCIQRGVVCIPKSVHGNRIEENGKVFDFELTPEEMEKIKALDRHARNVHPDLFLPSPQTWQEYYDYENVN